MYSQAVCRVGREEAVDVQRLVVVAEREIADLQSALIDGDAARRDLPQRVGHDELRRDELRVDTRFAMQRLGEIGNGVERSLVSVGRAVVPTEGGVQFSRLRFCVERHLEVGFAHSFLSLNQCAQIAVVALKIAAGSL